MLAVSSTALQRFGGPDPQRAEDYIAMTAAFLAGRTENTRRNYRCAIQQFFTLFKWSCPDSITPAHAAAFKRWLVDKQKVSDATAYNRISAVSRFFDFLCTDPGAGRPPLLSHNPFKHLPRNDIQPQPYGRAHAMRWETFCELLDAIPTDAMGLRDRALLLFFAYTGRRRQEVARLRVRDLYLDHEPYWYEVVAKGNKVQRYELPQVCLDAIRTYWTAADRVDPAPDEGVFSSMHDDHLNCHLVPGRPLANRTMNVVLTRAIRRAGLDENDPSLCIHAIRHMVARDLDEAGARLQDIQATLGHASVATTQVYLGQLAGPRPALTEHLDRVRNGSREAALFGI